MLEMRQNDPFCMISIVNPHNYTMSHTQEHLETCLAQTAVYIYVVTSQYPRNVSACVCMCVCVCVRVCMCVCVCVCVCVCAVT